MSDGKKNQNFPPHSTYTVVLSNLDDFKGKLMQASLAQPWRSLVTSSAPFSPFFPGDEVCDLAPGTRIKELTAVLDKQ